MNGRWLILALAVATTAAVGLAPAGAVARATSAPRASVTSVTLESAASVSASAAPVATVTRAPLRSMTAAAAALGTASGTMSSAVAGGTPLSSTPGRSSSRPPTPTAAPPPTATLTVTTVPAVAGLRLRFDAVTAITSASGTASFTAPRNRDSHSLVLLDTESERGNTRYIFSRWAGQRDIGQAFTPTLNNVTTRTRATITAVFTEQSAVSPKFVDQEGQPVAADQMSAATARSSTGAAVTVSPKGKTWLESRHVVYRSGVDLQVETLSYSWQSVLVHGSNVVDSGRQSFTPAETVSPTVEGQFHDLTVTAHDALFGSVAGSEVVLTFPDGSVQTAPMTGEDRAAVFHHLPRGTYQAVVRAGPAIVNTQHLRLSRDITVAVPVISLLDIAVLIMSITAVGVGLLLIGRRSFRRNVPTPVPVRQKAKVEVT